MKIIAIPTVNGTVDNHFGHCDHYTLFYINDDNTIDSSKRLESPQGCGCKSNIASVMQEMGITVMLAGNMGEGAFKKLNEHGISVIRGCSGKVEDVLQNYLNGTLSDNGEACNHHDCNHHDSKPRFTYIRPDKQ